MFDDIDPKTSALADKFIADYAAARTIHGDRFPEAITPYCTALRAISRQPFAALAHLPQRDLTGPERIMFAAAAVHLAESNL